jgi:hypothetical protein
LTADVLSFRHEMLKQLFDAEHVRKIRQILALLDGAYSSPRCPLSDAVGGARFAPGAASSAAQQSRNLATPITTAARGA